MKLGAVVHVDTECLDALPNADQLGLPRSYESFHIELLLEFFGIFSLQRKTGKLVQKTVNQCSDSRDRDFKNAQREVQAGGLILHVGGPSNQQNLCFFSSKILIILRWHIVLSLS